MKVLDFPIGIPFHTQREKSQFFKEIKKILTALNVGWIDVCCGTANSVTGPSGFTLTAGDPNSDGIFTPQWLDPETGEYIDLGMDFKQFVIQTQGKALAVTYSQNVVAVTQTLAAKPFMKGYYETSTATGDITLTLPSASSIASELDLTSTKGASFEFIIDNYNGTHIVTIAGNANITLPSTVVVTGSDDMDVAAGEIGVFRLVMHNSGKGKLFRVA